MFKKLLLVALLLVPSAAFGLTEIPCNGIDDDGVGGDLACPEPDKDGDGWTTNGTQEGYDCDDADRSVFPGVSVTCDPAGPSTDGYKTCQASGDFTGCIDGELREATGSGGNYYIDPVSGNNANNGTSRATAWADWSCVSSYSSGAPACSVTLNSGSVIYLMTGTHAQRHTHSVVGNVGLLIAGKSNITIKPYPGQSPVINTTSTSVDRTTPIYLDDCDDCVVDGVEITDNVVEYESGTIRISNSSTPTIQRVYIHDNTGHGDNNGANVYLTGNLGYKIRASGIYNYDVYTGNAANARLIVVFRGYGRVHNNALGFTSGATPRNPFGQKHANSEDYTIFDHNKVSNAAAPVVISGAGTNTWHHNIIADITAGEVTKPCFGFFDVGGPTFTKTNLIEYNTCLGDALTFTMVDYYDDSEVSCYPSSCNTIGTTTVRRNVFKSDVNYTNPVLYGIYQLGVYESDTSYDTLIGGRKINFDYNSYYTSGGSGLVFNVYGRNTPPSNYGEKGGSYNFTQWKAGDTSGSQNLAPQDVGSVSVDPNFDSYLRAQAASVVALQAGWNYGESEGPTSTGTTSAATTNYITLRRLFQ